jgi:hypothetical protein
LLIFSGNYAEAGVWGILPCGGIQWPKLFLVRHRAELLILWTVWSTNLHWCHFEIFKHTALQCVNHGTC